jgi:hypothetical protein
MDPNPVPVALLAVFRPNQLDEVRTLVERWDVPPGHVHIGEENDERASLMAEQQQEMRDSFTSPQAGVALPKQTVKALSLTIPLASLVGAIVLLPFAFIPVSGMSFAVRLFWCAVVGATAGGTLAFIVTSAMAAKDPFEPSAAQRGVVVRVDDVRPAVEEALRKAAPIRLDQVDQDGNVLKTVVTEEDRTPGGIIEEVGRNVEREQNVRPVDRHR